MNNPVNILFISYDGMTDPLGQSQVIPYLQGLCEDGYRIFLLSAEKEEVFEKNQPRVRQLLSGYNIEWVPVKYTKKPPVLSTLIDIRKLKRTAAKIHRQHHIHLVHTRPGIPSLVGYWMKKKFGVKFLNDIREFYADSRVDGGMWRKENFLYRSIYHYFKKQEAREVKASDGIVCLTHAAQRIIKSWPEYDQRVPLEVIPCSVDLKLFDPQMPDAAALQQKRTAMNIKADDLVISYLGSIGGWYMTAEMLQFCKQLSDRIPRAKFLFISPHHHQTIVDTAAKAGIDSEKIITTHAQRPEVPALLALSHYSIFFIKPCYSKLSSSPTKHGEIMAMGIPLITNSGVGDVKEIVEKYDSGFVIGEMNEAAFDVVIDKIASDPYFDKTLIRRGAEEFYALQNATERYKKIYRAILTN